MGEGPPLADPRGNHNPEQCLEQSPRQGTAMPWTQIYDPFGNPWLSTLIAALPIVLLLGLLASGRVSAPMAALAGLAAAFLTALFAYVPAMADVPDYSERVAAWFP